VGTVNATVGARDHHEIGMVAHADEHGVLVVESDGVPLHTADALAVMHLAASTVELGVRLQAGDEHASAD
jgi:hypothetical protein